jgi:fluoride exporter
MIMIKNLLLVGLGSSIGGIARFIVGRYIQSAVHGTFPWGTFTVNVVGCLVIGLVLGLAMKVPAEWKLFFVVGICGGFTTFSTFTLENFELLRSGDFFQFIWYSSLSVLMGLLATLGGYLVIKSF